MFPAIIKPFISRFLWIGGFILIINIKIMKNIKNTTKYFKALGIILIAVFFVVALPVRTFADDSSDTGYDYTYDSSSNTGYDTYDAPSNTGYDYTYDDSSNTGYDYTYDSPSNTGYDYTYDAPSNVDDSPTYSSSINYGTSYTPINYSYSSYPVSVGYSNYPVVQQPVQVQQPIVVQQPVVTTNPVVYYTQPEVASTYYAQQPTTYYSEPATTADPNQVEAYTDTPNVSSVYLSDVPYTGFEDYEGIIIFISILVLWSAILAYIFLKRKINEQNSLAVAYVKNTTDANDLSNDSVASDLLSKIASDNSDIIKVEEYARTNKVLLSSDASAKLVKLSRLGQINVSDYIRSIATGEWTAIGENQIK
jgi:hypothetical protein